MAQSEMTYEEMAQIVDQVRYSDELHRQADNRAWRAEQRAKAHVILSLLRRHLPTEILLQVEDLLSNASGSECVCNLLQREKERRILLSERPDAEEEEVENFLNTGIWRSKHQLAQDLAELDAKIRRGELPLL